MLDVSSPAECYANIRPFLQIAERLYQQGFLSYPRTETDVCDRQFDFMTLIGKQAADPAWGGFANGYA